MIKTFMDENFLLNNDIAVELYHKYAKEMPIFDYHSHINAREIAENKQFNNLTELWLSEDHYKWRILRCNGVEEKYITGNADDYLKFLKWAETVPKCIGNPMYHWVHLELKRYFGIDKLLSPATAKEIWDECNEKLSGEDFFAKELLKKSNVKVVCTTDDPSDNLSSHKKIIEDTSFEVKVVPTFRADSMIYIEREGFGNHVRKLGDAAGIEIRNFEELKTALEKRIKYFNDTGCRMADHSLEEALILNEASESEAAVIFEKAMNGTEIFGEEIVKYKTVILVLLGKLYNRFNWTMQLHIGPIRNNNKRMFGIAGPDTGFDAICDYPVAENLAFFLSILERSDELPKTIVYSLDPGNNEIISAMAGCFQKDIPLKIQLGPAWWYNDHKDGITKQIIALANTSLLSRSVGMVTDSRSFTSFTRHEYFRRILCDVIGEWVCRGEAPNKTEMLGQMIKDICWNNAANYFGI